MQFSCNGIKHAQHELTAFLHKHNIAIAALQETKLRSTSPDPSFPEYTVLRRDRPDDRGGGGVAFLIHDTVTYKHYETKHMTPGDVYTEHIGITAHLHGQDFHIINIYIPPCTTIPAAEHFTPTLNNFMTTSPTLIIGDVNAHHDAWHSHTNDGPAAARGDHISDTIDNHDYCTLNEDTPTRLPKHGHPSSPDITIINSHLIFNTTWTTHTTLSSDHIPITITLTADDIPLPPHAKRTYINFNRAHWEGYTADSETLFSTLPPPISCAVGEKAFREALLTAAKHNIPAGRIPNFRPNLTPDTRTLIAQRDTLRAANPQDPTLPDIERDIAHHITEANKQAWHGKLARATPHDSPKSYWDLLGTLAGKRTRTPPNQPITFTNKTRTQPQGIANAFIKQFTRIIPHKQNPYTRKLIRRLHRQHPLPAPDAPDDHFITFTPTNVRNAIARTNNSKAFGPDSLTPLHLKHLGPSGISYLTQLFNLSLRHANIPSVWKSAIVEPAVKPGKPAHLSSSYRPISLLSPAVKVLEALLLPRLTEYLPLNSSQHGFRKFHSTTTALLPLTTQITDGLNHKSPHHRTIITSQPSTSARHSTQSITLSY
jgi:hypothetical protein